MIPFDTLVRARLQNGGSRQPPPSNPPVTYADNGDDACSKQSSPTAPTGIATTAHCERPSFADDVDRIVDRLIADGDVKLDPATDAYVGTRGSQWRWRYNNG